MIEISLTSNYPYLILGEHKSSLKALKNLLENELSQTLIGNANYFETIYNNFGISDARTLTEMHLSRPIGNSGNLRIYVIAFNTAGTDSQNALLKLLEEPNESSRFFFITPSAHSLLPTLKSRLQIISYVEKSNETEFIYDIEKYLKLTLSKKFEFSKDIAKKASDGEVTREKVSNFITEIYRKLKDGITDKKENIQKIGHIGKIVSYSSDRSASIKLLLDNLAINLE